MSLSWTISNKAYPWLPAWNEGLAFAATLIFWIAVAARTRKEKSQQLGIAWPLLAFIVLAIGMPWFQYGTGLLVFSGDAFIVSLYLSIFLIAVHTGMFMAREGEKEEWMNALVCALVLSAIISVGIALIQWTKTWDLAVFILENDVGDRPGANLGQINNFNTLCFIAFCAVLYLYSHARLHVVVTLLVGWFLTLGMALTQSRTGWLQMAFIFVIALFFQNNKNIKKVVLILIAVFAAWYLAIPAVGNSALITADQNFRDLPMHDVRLTMWSALLEAVSMRPWFGYGWLQTGWAQQASAESIPILRSYMSYSHSFILDLVVWNGWPIAIILTGLLGVWFYKHLVYRSRDSEVFLYCAAAGIMIHGLLEYPLSYAYFLMPLGLMMGYLDGARSIFKDCSLKWNRQVVFYLMSVALYIVICMDYINAATNDVAVRMQSAQIGRSDGGVDIRLDFHILNQLGAMYDVRLMREDDYTDDKNVILIAKVARRYPYSPALFQYAWSRAMRGEYSMAEKQLKILCGIYSEAHCRMVVKRWEILQKKYPETVGIVSFPVVINKK